MLKSLFTSKKFIAMLAGIIAYAVSRIGFDVEQGDAEVVLGFLAAYIIGQGIADNGKEAAKLKAFDPTEPG